MAILDLVLVCLGFSMFSFGFIGFTLNFLGFHFELLVSPLDFT